MNQLYSTAWALLCCLALPSLAGAQGVTTASIGGRVTDATGEGLIGAAVVAVHEPSGTVFGNATDLEGRYRIPNMRVGGPYTIEVTYTGYGTSALTDVILRLGENRTFDFELSESNQELSEVVVVAQVGTAGENAGASTQITSDEIEALPTLNRDITDFVRLTPQSTGFGGGTSFAGVNNRYNAIYIDGAVNNDVFGLASSGTNGGQTGASPFSIDIIDQFQVVLSPYDVSLGGFAGGGINAVTKSGTNEFTGTAYVFTQNESLAGKTPGDLADRLREDDPSFDRTRLAEFRQLTYGASVGGPIVKDKVFFFVNAELQRDETPSPFEFGQYTGNSSESDIEGLRQTIIRQFDYDPGSFGSVSDELNADRFFAKLDVNLAPEHRLTLRHNYNQLESFNRPGSNATRINFSNSGVFFPSTTNSSAVELNSSFGTSASNNLILGYTRVRDDRGGIGAEFPRVEISDGGRSAIIFGTDEFSTGNLLEQSTFTITDNLKLYRGAHTFTFGTHNEFYSIRNVFIRQAFGSYEFDTLEDFLAGEPASAYDRTYSLLDENPADETDAAADFNAAQLGFYVQDEYAFDNGLRLTGGLRVDIPIVNQDVPVLPALRDSIGILAAAYPVVGDVELGSAPSGRLLFSPRVGFSYDFDPRGDSRLRGGVGVFTSRIPFVWPGAMYSNNGTQLTSIDERDIGGDPTFRPDPNGQYTLDGDIALGGQVDLFTEDFKYPQVLRGNLAYDVRLPQDFRLTFEGIYSKTLNNLLVTSVNSDPAVGFVTTGSPEDARPVFTRTRLVPEIGGDVYVVSNTSRGYTYSLTASLAKKFFDDLDATLAYTWGDAYSFNDGTSSQNSSSWRGQINAFGRNNPAFGRSDFALGHRVVGSLNYTADWGGSQAFATTFSLFFDGQTGGAYSYVLGPDRNFRGQNFANESGSASRNRTLAFIPATRDQINLVDITDEDGVVTETADAQWAKLNDFISSDDYLNENRGQFAEKNASWLPFQGFFDVAVRQNVGLEVGNTLQRFQVSLDIFNFANLLNSNWGNRYFVPGDFNNRILYSVHPEQAYEDDGTTPRYIYTGPAESGREGLDISGFSRWRARIGLRYIFN